MSEKMIENNKVSVIGEIVSGFTFSHEVFGEGFYMVDVAVNRLSEQADIIPLMVSERLLDIHQDYTGNTIEALGQFRSCKPPIYRKTPLGREIADILLAVNRPYGKSDYIPCISWGRNARFASSFEVGARVRVWGRVQSREYTKKLSETECEKRIAYEVSISKLECDEA